MNSDLLYDLIGGISTVTSRKAKERMMIPELKQVFEYAYDPFRTYGIKSTKHIGRFNGVVFNNNVWNLFDNLAARKLTGKTAQDWVDTFAHNLSYKSAQLFLMILNKDLRCGVSIKSINKVYGDIIQDSITMQPVPYHSRYLSLPCFVSYKMRGVRGYYRYKDNTIYSRRGKPFHGLQHLTNRLRIHEHDFDGELLVPKVPFETGAGIIRNNKVTSEVYYAIFDAPNKHMFSVRYNYYVTCGFTVHDMIVPVLHSKCYSEHQLMQLHQLALESGYEGVVAKDMASMYSPGYSSEWLKLKELAEPVDLEVIDVFEGKGKYANSLGGVVCDFNGVHVNVGSGFTDKQRDFYWANRNSIIGKTVEVEYQEKTKDYSLRNPVFKRIRNGK